MFKRLTDEYGFKRGYYINVLGIFRMVKYKVSKVMESDDYILVIAIFGKEFVLK
jgi:hypothetical protein